MASVRGTAGAGCGLSVVSVTSTSPGTGTLNGWESVPEVVKFPVNVSVTVGGANDVGCVGKVAPVFVDEQLLASVPITSNRQTLLNIRSMLPDGPDAPQPTGFRQWKRFSLGEARASHPAVNSRTLRQGTSTAAVVAAIAWAAGGISACTSTETTSTAPSSDKCQITVTNAPSAFTANGGTGTVTIAAARDCTWAVAPTVAWVTVTGAPSGQGAASVDYTVAANPVPTTRSGAIAVGSQSMPVSQAAAPCRFTLSRPADTIGAAGGALSVGVSTLTGCTWSATSSATWITIASGQNGSAGGTVELRVAANTGDLRVAALNIAGQTYTVNQDAASGAHASFSGLVSSLHGTCPGLTLIVGGRTVIADPSTKFTGIACSAIRVGQAIAGDGTIDATGAIHAATITKGGQ